MRTCRRVVSDISCRARTLSHCGRLDALSSSCRATLERSLAKASLQQLRQGCLHSKDSRLMSNQGHGRGCSLQGELVLLDSRCQPPMQSLLAFPDRATHTAPTKTTLRMNHASGQTNKPAYLYRSRKNDTCLSDTVNWKARSAESADAPTKPTLHS